MSGPQLLGAAAGACFGVGLWSIAARLSARRPHLDDRLSPYLRSPAHRPSADRPARTPLWTLERLLAPVVADAARLLERLGSPTADLERRLRRAGTQQTVERFRSEQAVAGVAGTAAGLVLAMALVVARGVDGSAAVGVVALGGACGTALRGQVLSRRVRRRERRMLTELPTVSELLALAVAAGESPMAALERIASTTTGELTAELRLTIAEARSGTPLTVALERLADRTGLVALSRFAEAMAIAIERGTPLAGVLRAQASDVREASRRELIEAGGRKELGMMLPVVFLILPITVVFTVFPCLNALRLNL